MSNKLNPTIRGYLHGSSIFKRYIRPAEAAEYFGVKIWKHWKTPQNRVKNLIKLGVPAWTARRTSYAKGFARVCRGSDVSQAINNKRLASFGLISMLDYYTERCA